MSEIKYQVQGHCKVYNPETKENEYQECLISVVAPWTVENEALAKKTAYNGEYTVEENGTTEAPSKLDVIEAQVTYTAMMTDTLLEV